MTLDAFARTLRDLRDDTGGNFALLFAVASVGLTLAAGTAVDITNALGQRTEMADALDAAVLATTRAASSGEIAPSAIDGYLMKVFTANVGVSVEDPEGYVLKTVAYDKKTGLLEATAARDYEATFGVLGSAGTFPMSVRASATYGDSRAEVAMTFDITGSMSGSKIADLKRAAQSGIDQLLAVNTPGNERIRIAAVPYAAAVNVGDDLERYVFADDGSANETPPAYDPDEKSENGSGVIVGGSTNPDGCATERKGALQYSSDGPDKARVNRDGRLSTRDCPKAKLVPLTANATALHDTIRDFRAKGTTAGPIGIQWAWYTLSKSWADFMPAGAGAEARSDKLHKYAVIMTDGEFNTAYAGVRGSNTTRQQSRSAKDALALCAAMKEDHIEIFTIGFGLKSKKAIETLKACASPARGGTTYFYNASTGNELAGVYQEIGSMIRKLRLVS